MLSLKATLLSLLPLIHAQSSSMAFFLLDTDPQELVASVITANPTAGTQYLVTCPSSVSADSCGYDPGETIYNSGSVWGASITTDDFTMNAQCTLLTAAGAGTSAICTQSMGGSAANDPGVSTFGLEGSEVQFFPVTVTAGLDKLASASTTESASSSSKTSSGSGTGSLATSSGASSSSRTSVGASATASTSDSGHFGVSTVIMVGAAFAFLLAAV